MLQYIPWVYNCINSYKLHQYKLTEAVNMLPKTGENPSAITQFAASGSSARQFVVWDSLWRQTRNKDRASIELSQKEVTNFWS